MFLAEVAPKTPIKLVRLKLLLFLQGSPFFDLNQAADRLEKIDLLKPELAVVLGRVSYSRSIAYSQLTLRVAWEKSGNASTPGTGYWRFRLCSDILHSRRGDHTAQSCEVGRSSCSGNGRMGSLR